MSDGRIQEIRCAGGLNKFVILQQIKLIKIKQKRILGIICLKINNKTYTHKTKTNKQTRPRGAHVRSYFDERLAYIYMCRSI